MQGMARLVYRIQTDLLRKYLKKFPVVAVVGARQTGKTTLVRDILKEKRAYLTFDDPATILVAERDAASLLEHDRYLTIDEAQKVPAIFSAIKRKVDSKRMPGQFLLTGSANITMLSSISETLAGRIVFVEMEPLTITELMNSDAHESVLWHILKSVSPEKCWEILYSATPARLSIEKYITRGGLPPACLERNDEARRTWFRGYIRTYLERDVRDLSRIQRLHDYQKYLSLLAFRSAQIFNKAEVARDCGIPYTTATHFFDLLLATYQVFIIEPYFRNIGKRLIKAPKVMWNDTGLAMYLQGLNTWSDAIRLGRDSFLVENRIAIEIKTCLSVLNPEAKLFYWRTSGGAEIDFVIETAGRLIPIEVKWKSELRPKDVTNVKVFMDDFKKEAKWAVVLYKGKQLLKIKDNIFLVPYEYFFAKT
jgi:hypothetical protein